MWRFLRSKWLIIIVVWVVVISFALVGCQRAPSYSPSAAPTTGSATPVGVQMFQWTWPAIAAECPTLAKLGYGFVQTSPPQESIVGEPWWVVYQPVSYQLESTLGTRDEFAAMVTACHEAGLEIFADAVINHMSGQDSGTGTAGTKFTHYSYPGLYSNEDFHHCGITVDDDIGDYTSQAQVQTCELVNLADLDTGNPRVQKTIAGYLQDLQSLGVDGFRIDAAKHMSVEDLTAIIDLLPDRPKLILEVIRGENEPIQPEDYTALGLVQEFGFARALSDAFGNYSLSTLTTLDDDGFLPSDQAVSFVDNHDTERNGETLSIAKPKPYLLGEIFLLGYGYGTPVIYSGYSFDNLYDLGPPRLDADPGRVEAASCDPVTPPWTCNHRDPAVAGMITFHDAVANAPATVQVEGNLVGVTRGGHGFVALNSGDSEANSAWVTELPAGSYCNLVVPDCAQKIEVTAEGTLADPVPANGAVAIALNHPAS